MALLIIGVVSGGLSLVSFLFSRSKLAVILAVILPLAAITTAVLSHLASNETEEQLTEIRTPRHMEPETERMLAARLKRYAGQKYDMKVFGDQDSLELATAIQTILEEAGWVYTNVYPKHATRRYAETRESGVFIIFGNAETGRTSYVGMALHDALHEAGLYDDSTALTPLHCVGIDGPIQEGTRLTPIPCSESPVQFIEIGLTLLDEVIPEETLVLHVGKKRL